MFASRRLLPWILAAGCLAAASLESAPLAHAQAPGIGIEVEFSPLQIALRDGDQLMTPVASAVGQGHALAHTARPAQQIGGIDLLKLTYDVGGANSRTLEVISGPVSALANNATNVNGHDDVKKAIMLFVDAVESHAGTSWDLYSAGIANADAYPGVIKVVTLEQALAAYEAALPAGGVFTRDLRHFRMARAAELAEGDIVFLVMRPGPDDDGEANPQANFGLTLGRYGAGALNDDYGEDGGFAKVAYGLLTGNGPTGIATWLAAAPNTATIGQSAANANMRGLFVYIRMHFLLKGYSAVMRPRMVELYTGYYERKIRRQLEQQGRLADFTAEQITHAARGFATEHVEGMWSWMPKNHWLNMPKASFDALLTAVGDGQQVVTRYTAWQGAVTLAASARQNAICNLPDGWANALEDDWERAHGAEIIAACREAVTAAGANLRATNPLAPHPVAPFQIGGNVAMVIESRVPGLTVRGAFRYSRRAPIINNYYDWTRDGSVSTAVRLVCTMNGLNRDTCQ